MKSYIFCHWYWLCVYFELWVMVHIIKNELKYLIISNFPQAYINDIWGIYDSHGIEYPQFKKINEFPVSTHDQLINILLCIYSFEFKVNFDDNFIIFYLLQAAAVEKKEHLYKILVIGELGTGKTSIIKRYVHQFFSQHYRATVSLYKHTREKIWHF